MKLCPKCHTENSASANFCTQCKFQFAAILAQDNQTRLRLPNRSAIVADDKPASPSESKRKTAFRSAEAGLGAIRSSGAGRAGRAGAPPAYLAGRRIVGLLVTYDWRREGEVFPIYEGRNYLGCDAECEIRLTADAGLSAKHAAIFYRGAGFEISDEKSLNGTWVNGKPAPLTGQPLPNYAEIKTGATRWRFIAIDPQPDD